MNFEPPESGPPGGAAYNKHKFDIAQDCSPLLRTVASTNKPFNSHSNYQNKNDNDNFKVPIHNRLGRPWKQTYQNKNENSNINNNPNTRNFNRKRRDNDPGPVYPKRKWGGNKYYHQNAHNQQNHNQKNPNSNSAQNRLHRIRNSSVGGSQEQITVNVKNEPVSDVNNDTQEFDATDITIEVVNHAALANQEDKLTRFKMILNPQYQAAIKDIQSKRKEKQVIFPFPVTPNVTGINLNERFTLY